MADAEKIDLILLKVQGIETEVQGMKSEMQDMKTEIQSMNGRIDNLESKIEQTERVLRNEIRKECGLVLDEVERVHHILDMHKADKSVHTA